MKKLINLFSLVSILSFSSLFGITIQNQTNENFTIYDSKSGDTLFLYPSQTQSIEDGGTLSFSFYRAGGTKITVDLPYYEYQGRQNLQLQGINTYSTHNDLQEALERGLGNYAGGSAGPQPGPAGAYNPYAPAAGASSEEVAMKAVHFQNLSPHTVILRSGGQVLHKGTQHHVNIFVPKSNALTIEMYMDNDNYHQNDGKAVIPAQHLYNFNTIKLEYNKSEAHIVHARDGNLDEFVTVNGNPLNQLKASQRLIG